MSELSTRPINGCATWVTERPHDRSPDDGTWEVSVSGELDLSCTDFFRDELPPPSLATFGRVVVDVEGVTFIDCGGLRALLGAAAACGSEVWLRSPSPAVRRFAELAGLEGEWRGIASEDEIRIR